MDNDYPILDFDPSREALIEPGHLVERRDDVPEGCVLCFFPEIFNNLRDAGRLAVIQNRPSELGDRSIYRLEFEERPLAVIHPGIGAPMAAATLEEIIALGCRKFIACGSAGVLHSEIARGHVIIPASALRDEGTSYHYLPPGREVSASPEGVAAVERVLQSHQIPYTLGKTWTTDAPYRETPASIQRRKSEGCIAVEMEAAAFFAVAQFRGVTFGQILYGGDDVGGSKWDARGWTRATSTREKLFWLAVEACLALIAQ